MLSKDDILEDCYESMSLLEFSSSLMRFSWSELAFDRREILAFCSESKDSKLDNIEAYSESKALLALSI